MKILNCRWLGRVPFTHGVRRVALLARILRRRRQGALALHPIHTKTRMKQRADTPPQARACTHHRRIKLTHPCHGWCVAGQGLRSRRMRSAGRARPDPLPTSQANPLHPHVNWESGWKAVRDCQASSHYRSHALKSTAPAPTSCIPSATFPLRQEARR